MPDPGFPLSTQEYYDALYAVQTSTEAAQAAAEAAQAAAEDIVDDLSGDIMGTSDTQTATNKTINAGDNTLQGVDDVRLQWVADFAGLDDLTATQAPTGATVSVGAGGAVLRGVASGEDITTAGGAKLVVEKGPSFNERTAASLGEIAAYPDGTIGHAAGLAYQADSSATGTDSAGNDLSVDGVVPFGQWYFEHFGAPLSPSDCHSHVQAAIDATSTGRRIEFQTHGSYRVTDTILLKRSDMEIAGPSGGVTLLEFVNASGGTVFSGDDDLELSTSTYSRCVIEGVDVRSVSASTDPSRVVDITSFSRSRFHVKGQTKRPDAEHYYGQGNSGTSPYQNEIIVDSVFGNTDGTHLYTQTAVRFARGTWGGGSPGPNDNDVIFKHRAAALSCAVDLQCGLDNRLHVVSAESIADTYIRLNDNDAVDSGTSSGSNTALSFNDTSQSWTTNEYLSDAIKITGGTGAGQVRIIKTNTATSLTLKEAWGVIPDATSTYEIYESLAVGTSLGMCRGEGLASLNPDFIHAYPGTRKTKVGSMDVTSLGSGLVVRDESGDPSNDWYSGKVVYSYTFTNPGPSANVNAYPRVSVFGGLRPVGEYVLEWMKAAPHYTDGADTADVYVDVGGTSAGGGSATLHAQIPAGQSQATALVESTDRTAFDGVNQGIYLNLQTGASYSATTDVTVTFCISLL